MPAMLGWAGWRCASPACHAASGAGTADELSRSTGIGAPELATALALLELAGVVVVDDGMVRSTIAR